MKRILTYTTFCPVSYTHLDVYKRQLFSIIMVGIWGTAIYSCHHYIIDVLLGISCALIGWLVFEYVLMRIPAFKRFFERYYAYIK